MTAEAGGEMRPRSLRWHAAVAVVGVVAILSFGAAAVARVLVRGSEANVDLKVRLGVRFAQARILQIAEEAADHARMLAADPRFVGPLSDVQQSSTRFLIEGTSGLDSLEASLLHRAFEQGPVRVLTLCGDGAVARMLIDRREDAASISSGRASMVPFLSAEQRELGAFVVDAPALGPIGLGASAVAIAGTRSERVEAWAPLDSSLVRALSRELGLDVSLHSRVYVMRDSSGLHLRPGEEYGEPRDLAFAGEGRPRRGAALLLPAPIGYDSLVVVVAQPRDAVDLGLRRAMTTLALVILASSLFLAGVFTWSRRRVLGAVDALVTRIEAADPERPDRVELPSLAVQEIERLRQAFARFFDRFAAGKVRQAEAEGTLGQVLRDAADAIMVLDRDHRVLQWNRGAEETFGYVASEIVGQPYAMLCPSGEEEPAFALPGQAVKDLRTRRRRKDGEVIDVSVARSRLSFSREGEERYVEIARDISIKRRLEQELMQSEKMAAVGKISSKVVHEIRNPLAAINLNVDLLGETLENQSALAAKHGIDFDPEAGEILDILKRETVRLSQIAEEYLQFSRLPRAAFREEAINPIVTELCGFLRPELERRRIDLRLELDPSEPRAVCDATLVRQALLNLLRNAVDAVKSGQGMVTIATRAAGIGPESGVEIEVRDNGRGIDSGERARLFEPFFTTKKDGTGLGLALVQRAAEEHGGTIICVSTRGEGASFRLTLPREPEGTRA